MNATQLSAFRGQAHSVGVALFPATVTIAGVNYAGSSGGVRNSPREIADGGMIEVREFAVRIQRSLFATAGKSVPTTGQKLMHRGVEWKIDSVSDAEGDPVVTIRGVAPLNP